VEPHGREPVAPVAQNVITMARDAGWSVITWAAHDAMGNNDNKKIKNHNMH